MESCLLYVGASGILTYRLTDITRLQPIGRALDGNAVRSIAVHPRDPNVAYVGCGLRGWGLHRTADVGVTFQLLGFGDRWVWDVVIDPVDPQTLWVGTEPPMLFVSRDAGKRFTALEGIDRLPSRPRWSFFYEPFRAGHIHGIAIHPARPERIFAGVEHGAFVFTHDGGATWQDALIGYDVHRVAVDPRNADRVLVGAGEGLLVSDDAGRTWTPVPELQGKYVHAIVFDPRDPRTAYLYVHEEGAPLYRSTDGGSTWRPIGRGLPAARPADTVCLHPTTPGVVFYAGDAGEKSGRIYVSLDAGESWQPLPCQVPKVWRMRAAPAP